MKIYLIPRWAANIHSDWYDWLTEKIYAKYKIEIIRPAMPNWGNPNITTSLDFLQQAITETDNETYFIGHSVGCQAILRYLDFKFSQNNQLQVGGFLFVAGWFEVDKPWVTLKPWLKPNQINYSNISENAAYKKVVLSDNDPFSGNFKKNKTDWEFKLRADVTIYPNEFHFNNPEEKSILQEVENMIKFHLNK